MKAKPKKPTAARHARKPVKKKPPTLTAREVRALMRAQAQEIAASASQINLLGREISVLRSWLDRCVGPMIHRLSLLGDWNLIKPEDGQRLMTAAAGEMTPVYIEWHLATYGVEATRKKYEHRLNALPPYLRQKL